MNLSSSKGLDRVRRTWRH